MSTLIDHSPVAASPVTAPEKPSLKRCIWRVKHPKVVRARGGGGGRARRGGHGWDDGGMPSGGHDACGCAGWGTRCGESCVNRLTDMECNATNCGYGEDGAGQCTNRDIARGNGKQVTPMPTPGKGWGLFAAEPITAGDFILEYTGEIVDDELCAQRLAEMKARGQVHFHMMEITRDLVIDAGSMGNESRFINHSCVPNCSALKKQVGHEVRVGIFAKTDIPVGRELTYDYQFVNFADERWECQCGEVGCRRFLGVNKQEALQAAALAAAGVHKELKRSDTEVAGGGDTNDGLGAATGVNHAGPSSLVSSAAPAASAWHPVGRCGSGSRDGGGANIATHATGCLGGSTEARYVPGCPVQGQYRLAPLNPTVFHPHTMPATTPDRLAQLMAAHLTPDEVGWAKQQRIFVVGHAAAPAVHAFDAEAGSGGGAWRANPHLIETAEHPNHPVLDSTACCAVPPPPCRPSVKRGHRVGRYAGLTGEQGVGWGVCAACCYRDPLVTPLPHSHMRPDACFPAAFVGRTIMLLRGACGGGDAGSSNASHGVDPVLARADALARAVWDSVVARCKGAGRATATLPITAPITTAEVEGAGGLLPSTSYALQQAVYDWCTCAYLHEMTVDSGIEEVAGDGDGNDVTCAKCTGSGDLLCCDGCPRAYHLSCLGMSSYDVPAGKWICPECKKAARACRRSVAGGLGGEVVGPTAASMVSNAAAGRGGDGAHALLQPTGRSYRSWAASPFSTLHADIMVQLAAVWGHNAASPTCPSGQHAAGNDGQAVGHAKVVLTGSKRRRGRGMDAMIAGGGVEGAMPALSPPASRRHRAMGDDGGATSNGAGANATDDGAGAIPGAGATW